VKSKIWATVTSVKDDTGMSSRAYWDASIRRGHEEGRYGLWRLRAGDYGDDD